MQHSFQFVGLEELRITGGRPLPELFAQALPHRLILGTMPEDDIIESLMKISPRLNWACIKLPQLQCALAAFRDRTVQPLAIKQVPVGVIDRILASTDCGKIEFVTVTVHINPKLSALRFAMCFLFVFSMLSLSIWHMNCL